jgi:hypothetical protein
MVLEKTACSKSIREMILSRWHAFNYRSKIIAGNYLALVADSKELDLHALEGLVQYFGIEGASHFCHYIYPESVFPISQETSYSQLKAIFTAIGIEFEDDDSIKSFDVWLNISNAMFDFAETNNLDVWQSWATVYDLGPRLLPNPGPYPTDQPQRIWIVATNNSLGEFADIDAHGSENVGTWAINKNARRGDLALMYCVTPRSAIVSVYRVACDAHFDPFGGWNGYRAELTDKISIPWMRLAEMKTDPLLKDWGLIKCNFQGLLNHEVPSEVWQQLKVLVKVKDQAASERLEQYANAAEGVRMIKVSGETWNETEVEEKLIIPVLQALGWEIGKTLDRQVEMSIKVGSGKPRKVRADFVGYKSALGSDATFVLETKRHISNAAELKLAIEQAESYAGKLRCTRFAVGAPEGFWIFQLQFPGQSVQMAEITLDADIAHVDISKLKGLLGYELLRT